MIENFSWEPRAEVDVVRRPDLSDRVAFARDRLGFFPDEKQLEVLQSTAKRGILNCSRQWGKSTVTAAKAIHQAYTKPESLVLVGSPGKRQSEEFLRKASRMSQKLDIQLKTNAVSLRFPNGSQIIGLPGNADTVRGFSAVSLILIDEASRVSDEMYQALRPMLAVSDGELWMMSTPNGQRGFFYQTWTEGDADWMRLSVTATECPRIPQAFLEKERSDMIEADFSQEYMCCFTGSGTEYFDRQMILDAVDEGYTELDIPKGY